LSHGEKRFDPNGQSALYDTYTPVGDPLGATRVGGVYAHNLVPELKGSSNTLKLHTSYTGGIVAAATLSKIDRENRDSNAKADYFIGAGDLTWTISPRAALFVKYRHREADMDTPTLDPIDSVCSPANNITNDYTCAIRPAISSTTDTVSGTIRYRPLTGLTLWGEYEFVKIRRENADEWKLPDSTQKDTASLSASLRLRRNLSIKAKYIHKDIDDPAYNIEPDHSDEGRISVSWIPFSRLNTMVSYSAAREKRHDLRFVEADESITTGENRKQDRDMLLGTVTFVLLKDLSATASYAYIHHKTQQDIEYHDTEGGAHIDPYVPDKNMSHTYAITVGYVPEKSVTLSGGVVHTISSGAFYPSSPALLEPLSVASFTDLKIRETAYTVSGEYRFKGGFAAGLQYRYSNLDDVLDNPNDDIKDGNAHIVLLSLTKKW